MADNALSDEELVKRVRSGDPELYAELIERYESRLLRYARYLVRDGDIARDVVQESFIKAYMNLQGFKVSRKWSSWIYRIVHNEAISAVRKRKHEVSLEDNKWIAETLPSSERVAEGAEQKELVAMMRRCLGELPLAYREPLVLYYLEDASYEEISDILRMSTSTVGTRIRRGKVMLRKVYEARQKG